MCISIADCAKKSSSDADIDMNLSYLLFCHQGTASTISHYARAWPPTVKSYAKLDGQGVRCAVLAEWPIDDDRSLHCIHAIDHGSGI